MGWAAGGKVQSLTLQGRGKEKHLRLPLDRSVSQGSSTGQLMRACGLGDPGRGLLHRQTGTPHYSEHTVTLSAGHVVAALGLRFGPAFWVEKCDHCP